MQEKEHYVRGLQNIAGYRGSNKSCIEDELYIIKKLKKKIINEFYKYKKISN